MLEICIPLPLLLEICIPLQPAGSQHSPWQLKPWEVKHNSMEVSLLSSCFVIPVLSLIPRRFLRLEGNHGPSGASWHRLGTGLQAHCFATADGFPMGSMETQASFPSALTFSFPKSTAPQPWGITIPGGLQVQPNARTALSFSNKPFTAFDTIQVLSSHESFPAYQENF